MSLVYGMGLLAQRIVLSMFFHFISWNWIDQGLSLWTELARSARTCLTRCGSLTWMTSWRGTLSTVVFPRRGEQWGKNTHKTSWEIDDLGACSTYGWLVWLGDNLDFIPWNVRKWTVSKCYHHWQHGANIITQICDFTTWRSWDLHGILQSMLPGMWSPTACLVIVGWQSVSDTYDHLRISMHTYPNSADWVGNFSECKVELCMLSFLHSEILPGVDVHDAVCIVLRFCVQNVSALKLTHEAERRWVNWYEKFHSICIRLSSLVYSSLNN